MAGDERGEEGQGRESGNGARQCLSLRGTKQKAGLELRAELTPH